MTMCWCTPSIRTPFCGKPGCVPPASKTPVPSVDDMAALIRQLAHSLRSARPSHDLPARALDYLKRHGLQGTVLREAEYMRQEAFDSLPDDYETN